MAKNDIINSCLWKTKKKINVLKLKTFVTSCTFLGKNISTFSYKCYLASLWLNHETSIKILRKYFLSENLFKIVLDAKSCKKKTSMSRRFIQPGSLFKTSAIKFDFSAKNFFSSCIEKCSFSILSWIESSFKNYRKNKKLPNGLAIKIAAP